MQETSRDIFGKMLWAYHAGDKHSTMRIRIDSEEDEPVPAATFFRELKDMPEAEKMALEHSSGRVLDVGAASGCHSLELQKKGLDVTSLDISPLACRIMEERGLKQVICTDIMAFEDANRYDTILLLMNGLGIAGSLENSRLLLDHLRKLLRPGGKVITDSSDLIYLYELEDGSLEIPLDKYYGEVLFEIGWEDEWTEPFDWVYIDPDMMFQIAEDQGWMAEIWYSGEHFDYLACLTPVEEGRA